MDGNGGLSGRSQHVKRLLTVYNDIDLETIQLFIDDKTVKRFYMMPKSIGVCISYNVTYVTYR